MKLCLDQIETSAGQRVTSDVTVMMMDEGVFWSGPPTWRWIQDRLHVEKGVAS